MSYHMQVSAISADVGTNIPYIVLVRTLDQGPNNGRSI